MRTRFISLNGTDTLDSCRCQVNYEGIFRYASSRWFIQALEHLVESGVYGIAVDVCVSATTHFASLLPAAELIKRS